MLKINMRRYFYVLFEMDQLFRLYASGSIRPYDPFFLL